MTILLLIMVTFFFGGCAGSQPVWGPEIKSANSVKSSHRTQLFDKESEAKLAKISEYEMSAYEHEIMGDGLLKKGNLHLAYVHYEKSLQKAKDNIRVQYKLGITLLAGGQFEEAISQFHVVLVQDPRYALAHQGLGKAYFKQKNFTKAEEHFQAALALDPKLWQANNYLGNIYDFQGRHEEAIQEYQLALAVKPNKGLVYANLGVSYALTGDHKKAVGAFNKALETGHAESKVYNNLGLSLAQLGKYPSALDAFKKAVGEAQAYNNLGCIYLEQGKRQEAIDCFEKAVKIDPKFYVKANENLNKARKMASR